MPSVLNTHFWPDCHFEDAALSCTRCASNLFNVEIARRIAFTIDIIASIVRAHPGIDRRERSLESNNILLSCFSRPFLFGRIRFGRLYPAPHGACRAHGA